MALASPRRIGLTALGFALPPSGRLTLTSAVPVLTSDVTAAGTIYYTPYIGGAASVYNGSLWKTLPLSELSLTLDATSAHTGYHQSGHNFDLFVAEDPSNLNQLIFGSGPAWSSDTARGTGAGTTELQMLGGLQVNKNSMSLHKSDGSNVTIAANCATCVGSFRASADGQCEFSKLKRFLSNRYNRRQSQMLCTEATDSWNYTIATWRQANANIANKVEYIDSSSDDPVSASVHSVLDSSTTMSAAVGIGVDSTTANSAQLLGSAFGTAGNEVTAEYNGFPGIGYHYLAWLEISQATGTSRWHGDFGIAYQQSGLQASGAF